ncbi:unnamed protein product [Spirodela intermedia]|uniref:Ribosomal protein S14 n=1 Tax=Spirodela intermedia TaxID=51605 RepID=A0ABN7ED45_SPIIN|nr:unnamed protein product [Spirodela intermedia]
MILQSYFVINEEKEIKIKILQNGGTHRPARLTSRGLSGLDRWGHVCTTPLPCHRWLADCGTRSGHIR